MCFILLSFLKQKRVFVFIRFSQLFSTPINFTFCLHFVIKVVLLNKSFLDAFLFSI